MRLNDRRLLLPVAFELLVGRLPSGLVGAAFFFSTGGGWVDFFVFFFGDCDLAFLVTVAFCHIQAASSEGSL